MARLPRSFRASRTTFFGVGSALVTLTTIAACQAIDGIHVYQTDDPETSVVNVYRDAGTVVHDGGIVYTGFGDAQCTLAKPPGQPPTTPDSNDPELVFAFRHFSFTGNGASVPGYDLDNVCTGESTEGGTGPSSCVVPAGAIFPVDITSTTADGGAADGIDAVFSAAGGLFQSYFNGTTIDSETNVQNDIDTGSQTALLVIDGYNQLRDDSQVTVSFVTSTPLQSTGCSNPIPADAGDAGPSWDGCDTWGVDRVSLASSEPDGGNKFYNYATSDAYVANGTLVAKFDQPSADGGTALTLPVGSVTLTPSGVIITAVLSMPTFDSGVACDAGTSGMCLTGGLIQGRLLANDFLATLGALGNPGVGGHICPGTPTFALLQTSVCSHVDTNFAIQDDGTHPCNAFTFASGFDAVPAKLGTPEDGGPVNNECPAADSGCP